MFDRITHHLRGRAQTELILDVLAMSLRRFGADAEPLRDILAGRSIAEQPQHFDLAQGEATLSSGTG